MAVESGKLSFVSCQIRSLRSKKEALPSLTSAFFLEKTANSMIWTPTALTVVGVLGGLALICVILGLVAIILKFRNRASDDGFDMNGVLNKAYE